MLNSYNTTRQNTNINAVSGTIIKNYKESFFLRFDLESNLARQLLSNSPNYKDKQVVVIQMMVCGEMEVIAEVIKKDDYNNYFE